MLPAGFETATPTSDRMQTHTLNLVATGIDLDIHTCAKRCKGNQIMKNLLERRAKCHV